jgi:hypothetical protein
MFRDWGEAHGLRYRKSFSAERPTDGVLLAHTQDTVVEALPVVALEVAVSECPKRLAGSIAVLEVVSPALGVVVIQEDEIRRGLVGRGVSAADVDVVLARAREQAEQLARTTRQRTEIWSFAELRRRYQLATGRSSLYDTSRERKARSSNRRKAQRVA